MLTYIWYVLKKGNDESYTTAKEPPIFWNRSYQIFELHNKITSSNAWGDFGLNQNDLKHRLRYFCYKTQQSDMSDSRKWDGMEGGCGRIESQGVWVVFLKKNNVKHVLIISRRNRHPMKQLNYSRTLLGELRELVQRAEAQGCLWVRVSEKVEKMGHFLCSRM